MKYLDQMVDKYGFNDGDSQPTDAKASREVYVYVVNRRAEALKSLYRIASFDRPGCHNTVMLVYVEAAKLPPDWDGNLPNEVETASLEQCDDAFQDALSWANDLELDGYVKVDVVIDWDGVKEIYIGNEDVTSEPPLPVREGYSPLLDLSTVFPNDLAKRREVCVDNLHRYGGGYRRDWERKFLELHDGSEPVKQVWIDIDDFSVLVSPVDNAIWVLTEKRDDALSRYKLRSDIIYQLWPYPTTMSECVVCHVGHGRGGKCLSCIGSYYSKLGGDLDGLVLAIREEYKTRYPDAHDELTAGLIQNR